MTSNIKTMSNLNNSVAETKTSLFYFSMKTANLLN